MTTTTPLTSGEALKIARDALRRSKANIDYHGYIAFTPPQLEQFVSMLAAPSPQPPVQAGEARDAEIARLKRGQFVLGQCVHNMVVAEQAAWIEWQHGAGAEQAMTWIQNGLLGPGHIPKHEGMTAQAYFDANYDDRMEPGDPRPGAARVPADGGAA